MKKLLLLLIVALCPLSTFASEGNTNFWGWVSYTDNYYAPSVLVYSWKFYNQYECKLNQRYDIWTGNFQKIEKDFPQKDGDIWTMNRVYCKVRDYQCTCIYK